MADMVQDHEDRLNALEALLRGDGPDTVSLDALPVEDLQNQLEYQWQPDGSVLLQPKTVTAKEIGVLPGGRMEQVLDQAVANGVYTVVDYGKVVYDFGGFNTPGAIVDLGNDNLVIRQSGVYVITSGLFLPHNAANMDIQLVIQGALSGAAFLPVGAANLATQFLAIQDFTAAANITNPAPLVATIMDLTAGDRLRTLIYQAGGAGVVTLADIFWGFHYPGNHMACQWIGTGRTA